MADTKNQIEEVGFMKFYGEAVTSGIIDAGSAGMALTGLNEAVRFFNEKQSPELAKIEYQVPVRTTEGSWTAWIVGGPIAVAVGVFAYGYLKKAGEKMAENDFKDIGMKDVLKKSLHAIQHLIKLVKHTKRFRDWDTTNVSWRNNSEIGIPNQKGEIYFLPLEYFRWYFQLPPKLISKITDAVEKDRTLSFGVKTNGDFEEASVNVDEKVFFSESYTEQQDDYLFPELKHGDQVKLEGRLIRGNAASNSLGFQYMEHTLNCVPESGSIRRFKPALFLRCVLDGTISRLTKNNLIAERRPTIIVRNVTPLENDDQFNLF